MAFLFQVLKAVPQWRNAASGVWQSSAARPSPTGLLVTNFHVVEGMDLVGVIGVRSPLLKSSVHWAHALQ